MNTSALRFFPTGLVLAAGATCAWPYLGLSTSTGSSTAPAEVAATPEVAVALLKPVLSPRPSRDPFADPEIYRSEARLKISGMMKK